MQPSSLEEKDEFHKKAFIFTLNRNKVCLDIKSGTSGFIDWGDNNHTVIYPDNLKFNKKTKLAQLYHTYKSVGSYTIMIDGDIELDFQRLDITDIKQWGSIVIKNGHKLFLNCVNLDITASDRPDLSHTTDLSYMFAYCTKLGRPNFNWDVKHITNMKGMFRGCTAFNGDLSMWDTCSVTNMSNMFGECIKFNGDLSRWNTGSVTDMNGMFCGCYVFNGDLSRWNTGRVMNMNEMFCACYIFNSNLSRWNTGRVIDMRCMFLNCRKFNQDLSIWSIENVTDMVSMFWGCTSLKKIQDWETDADTLDMYRNCNFD